MNKRILLFVCIMLAMATAQRVVAYDFSDGYLYYNITGSNTVSLTSPTGTGWGYGSTYQQPYGNVNIPSTVSHNGTTYTVTAIDNYAFPQCQQMTSVSIPSTVTSIGYRAFLYCSGLTQITIPDGVVSIGNQAFFMCTGISSITWGTGLTTIGIGAFGSLNALTSLTIPSHVTSIGLGAFEWCNALTSITVESGNTVYDSRGNCNAIIETSTNTLIAACKNTVIPSSVTAIGENAFAGQYQIDTLVIPSQIVSIAWNPFNGCSGLTSLSVESGNTVYDSRNNCNAIVETATNKLIAGCATTVIPNNVSTIGAGAFESIRTNLFSIDIPDNVTVIENYAFYACYNLGRVTIGQGVSTIGAWAFYNCSSLDTIISYATVPPILGGNVFDYVDNYGHPQTVIVPCASVAAYHANPSWDSVSSIVGLFPYNITANVDDESQGSVAIEGTPTCDTPQIHLVATALEGYRFDHWSTGDTINPLIVTLTSDTIITAYFAVVDTVETEVNVIVMSDNPLMGVAEGGGIVSVGTEVTITAIANEGYRFVRWSDDDTNAIHTVVVTSDTTFIAYFEAEGGTQDICEIYADGISICIYNGQIKIIGTEDEVSIFDMTGRQMKNGIMPDGIYFVRIGNRPARKVVVIR